MKMSIPFEYEDPGRAMMNVPDWLPGKEAKDQTVEAVAGDGISKAENGKRSWLHKEEIMVWAFA